MKKDEMQTQPWQDPRTGDEILDDPFRCTNCDWQGRRGDRVWAHYSGTGYSLRGFLCPKCYMQTTERIEASNSC